MSDFTKTTMVVLVLAATTGTVQAADVQPAKRWVWLTSQGVWGYGYQIKDGPQRGLWRIDPGSKYSPADPYGFADVLNRYRASAGLPPASYDESLSRWAQLNNVAQNWRGLGHFVNPNCHQNSGWNHADAESVAADWMNSAGHRETMLLPEMTRFGIAYGPGPYWTLNAK